MVDYTPGNPLGMIWRSLPPNVRNAYASVPNALAELSPGAAVRDTLDASGRMAKSAMGGDGWGTAGAAANMLAAAVGVVPGARVASKGANALVSPIKAYHGSPHNFDRFDASKIGTGEGAQAYGHGLYFAENEGVARGYRDALGGDAMIIGGQKIVPPAGSPSDIALAHLRSVPQGGEPFAEARRNLRSMRDAPESNARSKAAYSDALKQLDEWQLAGGSPGAGGNMYEVGIHADPQRFLDWDKPLSAQFSVVQDIARSADLSHLKEGNRTRVMLEKYRAGTEQPTYPATGHTLHNALSDYGANGNPALSQQLSQSGIVGTRYLDGGSRAAGDGSRNYVIFPGNEHLIEIVRKYGMIPVTAAGAVIAGNALPTAEAQ